jgi:hypothetical protein
MPVYEKELLAHGIGDIPAWLADDGLELALEYFDENDLNPHTCFKAKTDAPDSENARHWKQAEKLANRVLLSNSRYDNSMISLDFDVY